MYQLLCQLFLAVVNENLPEEVFEGTLYWLLQGKRNKRQIIERNVTHFSAMTPHQLEIIGWPREYIGARTSKGVHKVYSILRSSMFRLLFHAVTDSEDSNSIKHDYRPCFRYTGDLTYNGVDKVRTILYFTTREALEGTKRLIDLNGQRRQKFGKGILNFKLEAKDRSHMSCCYFCAKFMPCLSERLNINNRDYDIFNSLRHSSGSVSCNRDWNNNLCDIPICVECLNSKERQGNYRLNMFHYKAFQEGEYTDPLSSMEREMYNSKYSMDIEKPSMEEIPHYDKFTWETPIDYGCSYIHMMDKYSMYYWHPELTADEYMRLQEYNTLKILKNSEPLDEDYYPEDDQGDDLYDDYDDQ